MERTQKEKNIMKLINRSFTYLILFLSIFALSYSAKKVIDYTSLKKQTSLLEEKLTELRDENNKLDIVNSKLKDKNYFSVYVKDKYQYSSNNNSITPIK